MEGESISYYRRPAEPHGQAELVTIPVDDIYWLVDEGLRKALQAKHAQRNDPNHAHIVYAHANNTFSHGWRIPKRPLFSDEDLADA